MKKYLYYLASFVTFYFLVGGLFYAGGKGIKGKGVITFILKPLEIIYQVSFDLFQTNFTNGHLVSSKNNEFNELTEDLYLLNSVKNSEDQSFIEVWNLKDSKVIYSIPLSKDLLDGLNNRQRFKCYFDTQSKKVFVMANYFGKIACYDLKSGKEEWIIKQDSVEFHHRINAYNGKVYVNTRKYQVLGGITVRNEGFAVLNEKTGVIEKIWWLNDHVGELGNLARFQGSELVKSEGMILPLTEAHDYWHLNDVKIVPKLNAAGCLMENDILLSARNLNAIIHLRGDRIIHTYQGAFFKQHDVDIIDQNNISIFNNNTSDIQYPWKQKINSNVVIKNLQTNLDSIVYDNIDLKTATEGQFEQIGSYSFFENQNKHEIILYKNNKLVFRGSHKSHFDKSKVNLLNWCQIILPKSI